MKWKAKVLAYATVVFNFLLILSYLAFLSDPAKNTWIALAGLLYPAILFLNLVLFLIWFFKKKIYFLPTLIIIILGMYHHSRFTQLNPKISSNISYKDKLKVMSFNVRLFDLYNWKKNEEIKSKIIALIKDQKPDIVCLQEYFYDNNKKFITRENILEELSFKYYHESFSSESNKNSMFGLATFSKYPIINKEKKEFKDEKSNHCMWSDIIFKKDTLRVFNAHLGSIRFNYSDYKVIGGKGYPIWSHQKIPEKNIINKLKIGFQNRSRQLKQLIPVIEVSPFKKIICCDLNDTPISYAYNEFNKLYIDSFTKSGFGVGGTYIGKLPFLRIDYIWHDKLLNSFNFQTHPELLSDHKAISVEILF